LFRSKNKSNSLRLTFNIGTKPPSVLGFDALVDFNAYIAAGDEKFTISELKKLLAETEGLAFIKGKWVEINHQKLNEALLAYEQARKLTDRNNMTLLEAMRLQLNPPEMLGLDNNTRTTIEVTNGQWLNTIISGLTHPESLNAVSSGEDLKPV
jgi:non-specific serine/threonine protein kinase